MEAKENRPDACIASGTAQSIYKDFSTDAPDIQEELTGPVLPDECAAVSYTHLTLPTKA